MCSSDLFPEFFYNLNVFKGRWADMRRRPGAKHCSSLCSQSEGGNNMKLHESLKELRNKCLEFGSSCVQRLKKVFSSVGASFEDIIPSAEDISSTFDHIENEVDALDEVIAGHVTFVPC